MAVENVMQIYNELALNTDFAAMMEVVLGIALENLVGALGPFYFDLAPAVSGALGGADIYARINAVRREGDTNGGYLSTYLTFCNGEDIENPNNPMCFGPNSGNVNRTAPPVDDMEQQADEAAQRSLPQWQGWQQRFFR